MNSDYTDVPLAFDSLKQQALTDAENLASTTWTDHTNSDPGITILEQCIAQFLRLGEKLNLPVATLLQSHGDIDIPLPDLAFPGEETIPNQFFTANEILTTQPVNTNDRRRVLLDHPLVANAQVEAVKGLENPLYWNNSRQDFTFDELAGDNTVTLSGRYRALVELVPDHQLDAGERYELAETLLAQLKTQRNLSEQWEQVIILDPESIKIKGGISLKPDADVEQTLIDIHQAISDYINPPLIAKNRADLLKQGDTSADIYQGPKLENGYFDEHDLNTISIREEIRVSDLIRLILDFDQVDVVHSLLLSNYANPKDDDWREWVLPISSGRVPRLEPIVTPTEDGDKFQGFIDCFKRDVLCPVDNVVLNNKLAIRKQQQTTAINSVSWRDIPLPKSLKTDLSYQSLQQEFPIVYGLGDNQLPESVGPERLAKVKQLQGYLMLFDQVIANYHQQLANMGQQFDSKSRPAVSYQHGEFSATDMDELTVHDYWDHIKTLVESELTTNPGEQHAERENRLLSHLFARLGESFTDHSSLGFSLGSEAFNDYLRGKQHSLHHIAQLSQQRFLGGNYLADDDTQLSGAERRIESLLGLTDEERQHLVLVERALLYPKTSAHQPVLHHTGTISAQLRKDGNYYTIMHAPDHSLRDGDNITLFGFAAGQAENYAGLYAVTVMDQNTIELQLDLGLDPETDEIKQTFHCRWLRGQHYQNPYAMQVNVVINQTTGRFKQADFQQVLLAKIRAEVPAHISVFVRWLDDDAWLTFESFHAGWLLNWRAAAEPGNNDPQTLNAQLDASAGQLLNFLV